MVMQTTPFKNYLKESDFGLWGHLSRTICVPTVTVPVGSDTHSTDLIWLLVFKQNMIGFDNVSVSTGFEGVIGVGF